MVVYALLTALAAGGVGLFLGGISPWTLSASQPAPAAAPEEPPPVPSLPPGAEPPHVLPRAEPVRIEIDSAGVSAPVAEVGLAEDGTIEVPALSVADTAGWFSLGPSPGEVGPAAIVGHVDSRFTGAAVFYRIGELVAGDEIRVERADGTVAVFQVDLVRSYPKADFPYGAVFTGTGYPALRLITCGGRFDEADRSYTHNVVVYATLVSVSG
ncbi:sortase (surface protein transpeptidase) [Stackebrandtia albiflava]|uniref:Sortase (Surface protein transpeptidase) n=1 Tax=Stackebrandtia albiflava TaxID=406432 RepID=A0A562VD08_9ACTN|nr:sortase (surface protein transpeptidase) [Stackebrandtia albiflava]